MSFPNDEDITYRREHSKPDPQNRTLWVGRNFPVGHHNNDVWVTMKNGKRGINGAGVLITKDDAVRLALHILDICGASAPKTEEIPAPVLKVLEEAIEYKKQRANSFYESKERYTQLALEADQELWHLNQFAKKARGEAPELDFEDM